MYRGYGTEGPVRHDAVHPPSPTEPAENVEEMGTGGGWHKGEENMSWKDELPRENRYFETDNGVLYRGDCVDVMGELREGTANLIIADPPYCNIMITDWKNTKYEWDKWENRDEYIGFMREVFKEFKRVLKQTGSLYVFQDDKNVAYVQIELEKMGFYLENHIVWYKRDNIANKGWRYFRCFAPATERILFFSKEFRTRNLRDLTPEWIELLKPIVEYFIEQKRKIKEIMGYKTDREFDEFINEITNTRSIASRHYFTYSQFCLPTKEMYKKLQSINDIIGKSEVFEKDYETIREEYEAIKRKYEDVKRYFHQEKNHTDVWDVPLIPNKEPIGHPTIKPLKIAERIIRCSSRERELVLDPFMGSGTTAVACERLGRRWVGIEVNEEYCEIAKQRIKKIASQRRLFGGV